MYKTFTGCLYIRYRDCRLAMYPVMMNILLHIKLSFYSHIFPTNEENFKFKRWLKSMKNVSEISSKHILSDAFSLTLFNSVTFFLIELKTHFKKHFLLIIKSSFRIFFNHQQFPISLSTRLHIKRDYPLSFYVILLLKLSELNSKAFVTTWNFLSSKKTREKSKFPSISLIAISWE